MALKKTKNNLSEQENSYITLPNIFWAFFRIGVLTLGGGLAMMPVMRHEIVLKHKWMKSTDFYSMISLATAIPGSVSVNMAYLLGRRLGGRRGLIIAILATILPSFVIILLIAGMLSPFFHYPKVSTFLRGCSIAVVGQLAFASLDFAKRSLKKWQHYLVCIIGLIVIGVLKMHPLWGLISTSVLGFLFFPYKENKF